MRENFINGFIREVRLMQYAASSSSDCIAVIGVGYVGSDLAAQRLRMVTPAVVSTAKSTSMIWASSFSTRRGSSPRPACAQSWPRVFKRTKARKQISRCALTRSSR